VARRSLLLCPLALLAVAPPGVEQGTLPTSWITGGPNCLEVPDWQIHEYNPNLYILRESGCTNYEKPFLYLFFGNDRALLVDTGAGASEAAAVTQKLIARWLKRNQRETIVLVVAHTHAHGDHTAGDRGFDGLPNTTLIPATVEAEQKPSQLPHGRNKRAASISAGA
jgi:glyoxylase-like metal-dependent hydrolase (beta-lactamase superfamily II)